MENYIVRIYRRDETSPEKLAGIFESVEQETRNSFTSLNSLIDLLLPERGIRSRQATQLMTASPEQTSHPFGVKNQQRIIKHVH